MYLAADRVLDDVRGACEGSRPEVRDAAHLEARSLAGTATAAPEHTLHCACKPEGATKPIVPLTMCITSVLMGPVSNEDLIRDARPETRPALIAILPCNCTGSAMMHIIPASILYRDRILAGRMAPGDALHGARSVAERRCHDRARDA